MKEFGLRAVLTFFVLFTVTSFAYGAEAEDCRAIITKNYLNETAHFRLVPDDYGEPNFANDHVSRSIYYIRELLNDLGCSRKAINFSKGPNGRGQSRCEVIFPGKPHSRSCYIHTNIGFFFVTTDLTDGVNLLYSRWD